MNYLLGSGMSDGSDQAAPEIAYYQPREHRPKYLSRYDIQLRQEKDPILEALPSSIKPAYLDISQEVRQALVDGLKKTLRWQNVTWKDQPRSMNPDFRENDLEHVLGLIDWCNLIEQDYPALYAEISGDDRAVWHELLTMIVVHDTGEIGTGDVALTNQGSSEGIRKKKIEPKWAKYAISKSLPPEQSRKIISIYDRFEVPAQNDRVALTAKFLDKAQASGHVARDIIAYNLDKADYVQFEFRNNLPHTLKFAARLLELCKSDEAARQLQSFLQEHVLSHFDALEIDDIENLRGEVREKFPIIFAYGTDL